MQVETYIDSKGLKRCKVCNALKEIRMGSGRVQPCICKCEEAEDKAQAERIRLEGIKSVNKSKAWAVGTATATQAATFRNDNGKTPQLMEYCRKYADEFSTSSPWLVLWGNVGAGKSYAAAAICNEILEHGYSVRFTTLTQFERELFSTQDKAGAYAELRRVDLLVLDDLGISRATPYMNEIMFTVVDERLRTGKPMIVTTNMSRDEMTSGKASTDVARILSRLYEKAYFIRCCGEDQRLAALRERGGGLAFDE
jgi:DNA replication protein DnaC